MPLQNSVSEIRRQHNMTQAELASKVDVSRQTIIAIEKGNYVPSLELGLKISHVFSIPIEQLFTLE